MTSSYDIEMSVIVPVFRQWDMVRGLISALQRQEPSLLDQAEILLVNNGDPSDTEGLVLPKGFRVLHCAKPGSYAARNVGAMEARGRLFLFTDADCRPEPQWLTAYLTAFNNRTGSFFAGPVRMKCSAFPSVWERYDRLRGIPQAAYVARGYATTANLAVTAQVFFETGGFATSRMSGEDARFGHRARAAGYSINLVPEASVIHPCRSTAAEVIRKSRRIKGGQLPKNKAPQLLWLGLSTLPPLLTSGSVIRRPFSLKDRFAALLVVWILWVVDLAEALRLVLGGKAERR